MTRLDQIESLKRRIREAAEKRQSTGALTARLCALRTRQLREEGLHAELQGDLDAATEVYGE